VVEAFIAAFTDGPPEDRSELARAVATEAQPLPGDRLPAGRPSGAGLSAGR